MGVAAVCVCFFRSADRVGCPRAHELLCGFGGWVVFCILPTVFTPNFCVWVDLLAYAIFRFEITIAIVAFGWAILVGVDELLMMIRAIRQFLALLLFLLALLGTGVPIVILFTLACVCGVISFPVCVAAPLALLGTFVPSVRAVAFGALGWASLVEGLRWLILASPYIVAFLHGAFAIFRMLNPFCFEFCALVSIFF